MVSFKFNEWAAIGGSFIYAKGLVDWDKAVNQLGGTFNIKDDKASGTGFGLGFYLKPSDNLDVSIAYRSPVEMKAKKVQQLLIFLLLFILI
jgi:long-chain fatty acid transport protein